MRLRERKRNRLGDRMGDTGASVGRRLFDAARTGGAQALGLASGAIAAGQTADIVVLDASHPALVARSGDTLVDSWIFSTGDGAISDVFAGGRHLVAAGRHIARDAALRRYTATLQRLLQSA